MRDSIHLAFPIATLNGVDILSCDLKNAYLNAECHEKIWFEGGLECREDTGKVCVVIHALYGLKVWACLGEWSLWEYSGILVTYL